MLQRAPTLLGWSTKLEILWVNLVQEATGTFFVKNARTRNARNRMLKFATGLKISKLMPKHTMVHSFRRHLSNETSPSMGAKVWSTKMLMEKNKKKILFK